MVTVRGPLDLATAPLLRNALAEACGQNADGAPGDVTVDFEAVTFCGADVLGLLAATAATAARLRLSALRPRSQAEAGPDLPPRRTRRIS